MQNSRDGVTGCRAGLSIFLSVLVRGSYLRWNSVACASFFFIFFSMLDMDMVWKKRSPTLARVGILRTQRQQQNQPSDNAEWGRLCTTAQSSGPSLKDLSSWGHEQALIDPSILRALLLLPVKRPQSLCHFVEHNFLLKKKLCWIIAIWRPLTQICRWSWPQWLPGAGHSSLWWFSAGMSTAGAGFGSVAVRTAGCVFVDDVVVS